jgi:pyruvate carboxylase
MRTKDLLNVAPATAHAMPGLGSLEVSGWA